MGRYAAVVGDPIAHSRSPLLHRAAYAHLGLDWDYRAIRVAAGGLAPMLANWDPDCVGLSVTMPLKREALAGVDYADGLARVTGSCNTVVPGPTGLAGFNTDVYGIVQAVRGANREGWRAARCVILGAGATAASALAASVELGCTTPTLIARAFSGPQRAPAAAHRQGIEPTLVPMRQEERARAALGDADLVISTLPAHVADVFAPDLRLGPDVTVLDVAYDPWPSALARAATAAGARVVSGYRMLIHQAVMQIKVMTSRVVPAEVLTAALREGGELA